MSSKLKAHPYADTYPMMSAEELAALVEDIRERGLKRDIVLFEGMILDGRNRYEACLKAGVEPRFVEYKGKDPLEEVNSLNQYRQMTPGQRALVAARQWMIEETHQLGPRKSAESAHSNGRSAKALGKRFRCSDNSIRQARDLLENATDLVDKVDGGQVLAEAFQDWQQREREKEQHDRDMARIAKYREKVEAGKMKLAEAMRLILEEERQQKEKEQIEAHARRTWLEELEDHVAWFEAHLCPCKDSEFPWFTEPGTPGMFDHDITAERISELEKHLARFRKLGLENSHVGKKGTPRRSGRHSDS